MTENTAHRLSGVLYCVFGLFTFALQDTIVKDLSDTFPVLELLALRTYVVLVGLAMLIIVMRIPQGFGAKRPGILMLRGVIALVAFTCYYLALSKMALADGAAIYMTGPLFVTALSVPLLGERVGWHRWAAVAVGFAAAVYMVNPGSDVFQIVALLPLVAAVAYAFIPIINRKIGLSEHALTIALYAMIAYAGLATVAGVLIHLFDAQPMSDNIFANLTQHWLIPDPWEFTLISLSGILFIIGLLALTQAYRTLPVSIVAPFEYSYIVWATLLGYLVFSEVPSTRTWFGGAVIIACGCYVTWREKQARRAAEA